VPDRFQDGRRRHVEISTDYCNMGNYRPIFMKFGPQTKTGMLSFEITKAEFYSVWPISRWPPLLS
jgi:hypothetical protein